MKKIIFIILFLISVFLIATAFYIKGMILLFYIYLIGGMSWKVVEDITEGNVSNYKYTLNFNPDMWIPVDVKTIK